MITRPALARRRSGRRHRGRPGNDPYPGGRTRRVVQPYATNRVQEHERSPAPTAAHVEETGRRVRGHTGASSERVPRRHNRRTGAGRKNRSNSATRPLPSPPLWPRPGKYTPRTYKRPSASSNSPLRCLSTKGRTPPRSGAVQRWTYIAPKNPRRGLFEPLARRRNSSPGRESRLTNSPSGLLLH